MKYSSRFGPQYLLHIAIEPARSPTSWQVTRLNNPGLGSDGTPTGTRLFAASGGTVEEMSSV